MKSVKNNALIQRFYDEVDKMLNLVHTFTTNKARKGITHGYTPPFTHFRKHSNRRTAYGQVGENDPQLA